MTIYNLEICEESLLNDPILTFELTDAPNINIGEKILHAWNNTYLNSIHDYFSDNLKLNKNDFSISVIDKGHYFQESAESNLSVHTTRIIVKAIEN